jgi:hypothetical protein
MFPKAETGVLMLCSFDRLARGRRVRTPPLKHWIAGPDLRVSSTLGRLSAGGAAEAAADG